MQRRFLTFGFWGAVAFGVGGHALAQPPQPAANLKAQSRVTFEDGRVTFKTFGDHAQASITREAGNVKEGVAALRFDYQVQNGEINALAASFDMGAAEEVISFRFWVKTDAETNMALVLQEKDGGRYAALFHTPKDTWQQVQISLSDFYLTDDKDDPHDPNNQLDMDRVDTLARIRFLWTISGPATKPCPPWFRRWA
jgi:Carbohydrate binding domain (family 11)